LPKTNKPEGEVPDLWHCGEDPGNDYYES